MNHGGFVDGHLKKFQPLATRAQQGQQVKEALAAAVSDTQDQAAVWNGGGGQQKLMAAIAGKLRLDAQLSEAPEPALPNKLMAPKLNLRARGAFLRRTADLLAPKVE